MFATSLFATSALTSISLTPAALAQNNDREPFSLNASKTQENNRIPRTPFTLNATRYSQGAQQNQPTDPSQLQPQTPNLGAGGAKFDVSAFQNAPLQGSAQQQSPLKGSLQNQTPLNGLQQQNPLKGSAQQQAPLNGSAHIAKQLANYDIELLVDESMSMRRIDCPYGASRWNWCGMQALDLAKELSPFVRDGFTLTTFAGGYRVYKNANPNFLISLFQNPDFTSGTRMAEPLDERLSNHLAKGGKSKPLLIAVITDGVPAPKREPFMVTDVLINATKQMRDPKDITIVFFQIGTTDFKGKIFLDFLDHGLVQSGAKYDIVRNVPMERLMQVGLGQALVDSIHEASNSSAPSASASGSNALNGNAFNANGDMQPNYIDAVNQIFGPNKMRRQRF